MEYGYVIKLSNRNMYKEIQLPVDGERLKIGMEQNCDVRLYKDDFFEKFELDFTKTGVAWQVLCSQNIYIDAGDVMKLVTKQLTHGDSFSIKYRNSDKDAFKIEFLYDFDNENKNYDRIINIAPVNSITIGSSVTNNIVLGSRYAANENIMLKKQGHVLYIVINQTMYGVYHNGKKAANNEVVKNGDFISVANFSFYFKNGTLRTQAVNEVGINGLTYVDCADRNSFPRFNRSTRIKLVVNDEKIPVLDPPAKPQKPKNNLLMRMLPSLGMLGASFVMASMGGSMIIFSAISGGMAIVTSIIGVIQNKKYFKKNSEERIEKYRNYIQNKRIEIENYRQKELQVLDEIYISQEQETGLFNSFSPALFDRSSDDEDFLTVRFGIGDVVSKREIDYKKQEKLEFEDDLQELPEKICGEYKYIHNAPIVCNLKEINAIGIVGPEKFRFEILKNMVVDLCARQYHSDVKMVFVAKKEHKAWIHWLRMLPQVYNSSVGARNIVCDDDSKNLIFEYLYNEFTSREQSKTYDTNIVLFFYDEYGFKSHPISKFLDKAKDLGATFVFFGDEKKDIAMGCDYIVDIKSENTAELINTADRNDTSKFTYTAVPNDRAMAIVNTMAPVYTDEISLEGTLTKNITLFELLHIMSADDMELAERWSNSQVFKSMAAPIGVSKSGGVSLDLHDKAHGPHGLVAGTTGSGKSELLQTYILSMATLYHPYEVAFVIIDFKGGGMVNQFRELPHLLGAITNIDGKEIDRSLKSIKAELQKRQRLFAEADVNHIDKYIKKYKAGEVKIPLPHLIIIVDEFAELKAEQPEFMKELISAARIGRSLGVHLILATQKPSGQVNEQIWSNSRFKLCLKVQSQEDSNEVLKSPLAAEIKEAGRAYLQVGNNEIFELFQSAYSGAPEKSDDSNIKEFTIYQITDSGKRVPVYVQKKSKQGSGSETQLDAIVKYIETYCNRRKLKKLPDICLPSLEHVIGFPDDGSLLPPDIQVTTEIGIYDDPDAQYQGVYSLELSNQNVMIIGSAQSGKTNILQCIVRSIASKYTPDEVNIYIIDFASRVLKNFEPLRHVGGVVTAQEDEKLKNLMKLLRTEIEMRKEKLMSIGVSSFTAYREAGKRDLPQIVLMIDNLTALKEMYFEDDTELLNICREGISVGISVVIANAQTAGIGYKYLSNFSCRIAMFCNDSGEYSSLFDHCSERIEDIHGRCIVEIDKAHLECQAFMAFEGEKEIDRANAIKKFISSVNEKYRDSRARMIPEIPKVLTSDYVVRNLAPYMSERFRLLLGLDYSSVSPYSVALNGLGAVGISGREGMGRHNFIRYLVQMLEKMYPGETEINIVDGIGRRLAGLESAPNVVSYDVLPDKAVELVKNVEAQLKERYDALAAGNDNILGETKLIVLVINSRDAADMISANVEALNAYKNIIGKYKSMNVCVFVGDYENANVPYGAPEVIKRIKDSKQFMYFDDISNMKIFDMPLAVVRAFKKPIETGDCYYIRDNEYVKLKTVLCTDLK